MRGRCTKFAMRPLLFFILTLGLTNCQQSKNIDCNTIKTEFYSTGKIKNIVSLNSENFKNGECFYFNEYGFLDSSMTFSNGILQGLKRIFYENETDIFKYNKGRLISFSVYDSSNVLEYQTPLNIAKVGKTVLKFFSNRDYFDRNKEDTFTISNAGLPLANRRFSVQGGAIEHLRDSTFSIKPSKLLKDSNRIIIKVFARRNLSDSEYGILIDSVVLPVK